MLPTNVALNIGHQTANDATGLVTRTETNGGFASATFQLTNLGARGLKLGDRVTVFDSTYNMYAFVGRVQTLNLHTCTVGCTRSTTDEVVRYSTVPQDLSRPSGVMAGKVYPSGTPYDLVLVEALTITPNVFDGGISNCDGLQFVGPSVNIGGYTAEQIWTYICSLTNALATPLQWHIRSGNGLEVVVIEFADIVPRYFVQLPEDQIDETYDLGILITRATVEWGNKDVQSVNLAAHIPETADITRDKYANGTVNVNRLEDAAGLADNLLGRYSQFRSANDTLTVKCNQNPVRVVPPVVQPVPIDNLPLYLVESGHAIALRNRTNPAPYNQSTKFIVGTEYTWDTGVLILRCGEPVGFDGQVNNIVDYNVNRLYFGPPSGAPPRWGNSPLVPVDQVPIKGPSLDDLAISDPNQPGDKPPAAGIPMFTNYKGGTSNPETPFVDVLHPGLLADKGLEINYSFDISSVGWKGGTWSIPGTLQTIKFSLWKATATNGLQPDTCTFSIYTRKQGDTGTPLLLQQVELTGSADGILLLVTPKPLPAGDYQVVFKVDVPAALAEIINVSLHGPKLFPGLKV